MLTPSMDEATILKALKAGAKGYLSKDASVSDLIKAIEAVHQGELWIERKLMARFFGEEAVPDSREEDRHVSAKEELTPREHL
jgi:two-component system nitrate/nitrite response regulator NarL